MDSSELTTPAEVEEKQPKEDSEESLSALFRKYPIENYFWRNYPNKSRTKSLIYIFLVAIAAIVITFLVCRLLLS